MVLENICKLTFLSFVTFQNVQYTAHCVIMKQSVMIALKATSSQMLWSVKVSG